MRFEPERAALVLVDLQRGFIDDTGFVAAQGRDVASCWRAAESCLILADGARQAGLRVIWTRHVLRPDYADGGLLVGELRPRLREIGALRRGTPDVELVSSPRESDWIIDKPRYSAFLATELDMMLRAHRIESLVVGGVTTSMCVESTVRDAAQRDYRCFVVAEAVADFDHERHLASLAAIRFGFGRVVGSDALVAALQAGGGVFPAA
jgi:ureidoacrylate peracid hydrolase